MIRKDLNQNDSYGINSHKRKAVKVFHKKIRTTDEIIMEFKIWSVPKCIDYPEGVKYSFFAVRRGSVLVGYDNHRPKGHHRHFLGKEEIYLFRGFSELKKDFLVDLNFARKWMRYPHGT